MTRIMPFRLRNTSPSRTTRTRGDWDSLLDDLWGGWPTALTEWPSEASAMAFNPKLAIKESGDEYTVTAELPGMAEDDIEVGFSDNSLTIKGEKKFEKKEEEENFKYNERQYGSFYRSVPFAVDIDENKIDAHFTDGVLTITLAKAKQPTNQSKKINIRKK